MQVSQGFATVILAILFVYYGVRILHVIVLYFRPPKPMWLIRFIPLTKRARADTMGGLMSSIAHYGPVSIARARHDAIAYGYYDQATADKVFENRLDILKSAGFDAFDFYVSDVEKSHVGACMHGGLVCRIDDQAVCLTCRGRAGAWHVNHNPK